MTSPRQLQRPKIRSQLRVPSGGNCWATKHVPENTQQHTHSHIYVYIYAHSCIRMCLQQQKRHTSRLLHFGPRQREAVVCLQRKFEIVQLLLAATRLAHACNIEMLVWVRAYVSCVCPLHLIVNEKFAVIAFCSCCFLLLTLFFCHSGKSAASEITCYKTVGSVAYKIDWIFTRNMWNDLFSNKFCENLNYLKLNLFKLV